MALYAWYSARSQAANGSAAIKNQVYIITKNSAELSINYLLTEDVASLETFVVKLAEFPHVLSIEVCNRDGLVLSKAVHEGNARRGSSITSTRSIPPPTPVPSLPSAATESSHGILLLPDLFSAG